MNVFFILFFGFFAVLASVSPGWSASEKALNMRSTNALTEYSPPDSFLNGNFIADEVEPAFIFGKVRDFEKSRSCSTAWLVDNGEKQRIERRDPKADLFEYTLLLEEDCSGKVVYYVFVDRSLANTAQWLEWRKQFHKNKADPHYGAAKAGLEKAAKDGFAVEAELRFVEIGGNLDMRKPEELLTGELKIRPVYDIQQGKALNQ